METEKYWSDLIAKGATRFFLLARLARKPMHGYELARDIAECCNGCCAPTDAMIYPTIKEMVQNGLISCIQETVGGRVRKVCTLTDAGHEALRTAARSWQRALPGLQNAVADALTPNQGEPHDLPDPGSNPVCCD